jgi:hypothetical protein
MLQLTHLCASTVATESLDMSSIKCQVPHEAGATTRRQAAARWLPGLIHGSTLSYLRRDFPSPPKPFINRWKN